MNVSTDLLQALPVAVYTTDAAGNITFFNEAAAAFWGYRPELGSSRWYGSWRLFWADGRPMRYDECPMAVTLRDGVEVRGVETVAERPDGSRVAFIPQPSLLRNDAGEITGAVNMLVDISDRELVDVQLARLAAIVSSSDDAIISKTLDGRITSWNAAATRIFGYEPAEMIGQPITKIIPPELIDEEKHIIARLRLGERIEHFDTVRLAKDGRRLEISLTVSPLVDKTGRIVGASKVARDITDRKQSEALQRLLFDELNHRVKNTLATVQALASHSLRTAASPADFVGSFNGRIQALARAHDLLVQGKLRGTDVMGLMREQVVFGSADGARIACAGPVVNLTPHVAVQLALVLHELATNARKYGALSAPDGKLSIAWTLQAGLVPELFLDWRETGVPGVRAPSSRGFGTTLIERSIESSGGEATMAYGSDGLRCTIRLPLHDDHRVVPPAPTVVLPAVPRATGSELSGKRILVIEDEPLLAMDIEDQLRAAGCEVIGPVGTIADARRLIEEGAFDAALMDANLVGSPVDELAAALTRRNIPFVFATGYGREALPAAFRHLSVLAKPFSTEQLTAAIAGLVADRAPGADIVLLRRSGVDQLAG